MVTGMKKKLCWIPIFYSIDNLTKRFSSKLLQTLSMIKKSLLKKKKSNCRQWTQARDNKRAWNVPERKERKKIYLSDPALRATNDKDIKLPASHPVSVYKIGEFIIFQTCDISSFFRTLPMQVNVLLTWWWLCCVLHFLHSYVHLPCVYGEIFGSMDALQTYLNKCWTQDKQLFGVDGEKVSVGMRKA